MKELSKAIYSKWLNKLTPYESILVLDMIKEGIPICHLKNVLCQMIEDYGVEKLTERIKTL